MNCNFLYLKKSFLIHDGYDSRGLEHIDVWNSSMARKMPGARHLSFKQMDESKILRTKVEKSLDEDLTGILKAAGRTRQIPGVHWLAW